MSNLDLTFNSPNGFINTDFGFTPQESFARSILIQPDGKIIMAGETTNNSSVKIIALARYNSNGSLDNTFGTGGLTTQSIGTDINNYGLALLSNGKIIVTGTYNPGSSLSNIYVAAFSSNGSLDLTFGTSPGYTQISPSLFNANFPFTVDNCYSSSVQIDTSGLGPNKIVIGGFIRKLTPNRYYVALVRLNLNGSLDSTFGTNGLVAYNFNPGTDNFTNALVISSSGDYFLCGSQQSINQQFSIYKFDTNGAPIASFGSSGFKLIPNFLPSAADNASCLTIQSDGKIVVAGSGIDPISGYSFLALARIDSFSGNLDPSFGLGGQVITNLLPSISLSGNSIVLQPDGKIIIGGSFFVTASQEHSFALARYNTNGSLDTTFGTSGNGLILDDLVSGTMQEQGYSVALQTDGKIVLGGVMGEFSDISDTKYFILARYLPSIPTPTPTPTPTPNPTPSPTPNPLPNPIVPICFPAGTMVSTDQGDVEIQLIDPNFHTICDNPILAVTETIMMEKYIVCIEKHALGYNVPDKRTFITKYHCIKYNNKLIEAYRFIGRLRGIYYVKYNGELLYNILMQKHYVININNLKVESLYPKNIVARLYTNNYTLEEKRSIILKMNEETLKRHEINMKNNDLINNYNRLRNIHHTRKAFYQNNYLIGNQHHKTIRRFTNLHAINNQNHFNIFTRKYNIVNRSHYMGRTNKRFRR